MPSPHVRQSHVSHTNLQPPDISRPERIKRVASRFYVDEPMAVVRNGLSTDVLCARSDLQPARWQVLTEKIHDAMEYATAFTDVEELNALQYIAPSTPNYYLTLGLYLYLADEASRHNNQKSFLSALREAKVSMGVDDKPDQKRLFERCKNALHILGMDDPSYTKILEQWKRAGRYTLQGEHHISDKKGNVRGTYAELARLICQRQKYLSINLAVSYAQGNKDSVAGLDAQSSFDLARKAVQDSDLIDQKIESGFDIREVHIINKMIKALQLLPLQDEAASAPLSMARARPILEWLPDAALEMLDRERYICAYADAPVIGKVYPAQDPPGISHKVEEDVRNNKGQWLKRYRTIFMSNGYRQYEGDTDHDPSLKSAVVAQTLMHEVMHMAIAELPQEKRDALKAQVLELSEELKANHTSLPAYFNQPLRTIDTNSLLEVLDASSRLYRNYSNQWEEVVCNMYGLMHTEFDLQHGLSHEHPFTTPPAGLERLADIARQVEAGVNEALGSLRQNPSPNWGVDRLLQDRLGRAI